jgi:hypothetical protein
MTPKIRTISTRNGSQTLVSTKLCSRLARQFPSSNLRWNLCGRRTRMKLHELRVSRPVTRKWLHYARWATPLAILHQNALMKGMATLAFKLKKPNRKLGRSPLLNELLLRIGNLRILTRRRKIADDACIFLRNSSR